MRDFAGLGWLTSNVEAKTVEVMSNFVSRN
jgi:hypothetical protein